MRWLMANGANDDEKGSFIDIVEHSIFADTQFPDWVDVYPWGNDARQWFAVFRLLGGFVLKLLFQPVQQARTVIGSQTVQVFHHSFGIGNLVPRATCFCCCIWSVRNTYVNSRCVFSLSFAHLGRQDADFITDALVACGFGCGIVHCAFQRYDATRVFIL